MRKVPVIMLLSAATLAITALTGCSAPASSGGTEPSANTDPRIGEVKLPDQSGSSVSKRCDGSSLLYVTDGTYSGSLVVLLNNRECTSSSDSSQNVDPSMNPRFGEVKLPSLNGSTISKRCDGTSLIYITDGTHTGDMVIITDSAECAA